MDEQDVSPAWELEFKKHVGNRESNLSRLVSPLDILID